MPNRLVTRAWVTVLAAVVAAFVVAPHAQGPTQGTQAPGGIVPVGSPFSWGFPGGLCRGIADGVWQCVNNAGNGFTRFILGTNDASTNGISLQLVSGIPLFKSGDGSTSRGMAAPSFFASDGTNNIMTADGGPIFGSSNASLAGRSRTSMATPASLANGDWWVEADTGAITGNYGLLKTRLNGVTAQAAPSIVKFGRATAQTAANASVVTFTVGGNDGSYEVSANVLVTASTTHTFNVECAYTDEGNTARIVTMPFRLVGDTTAVTSSVANGNGAVPYNGIPLHLRVKASTAITIRTQAAGTYTTVTYNVEGEIRLLQ